MRDKPISDLRRRMIADMTVRSFSDKTQHDYGPHALSAEAAAGACSGAGRPADRGRARPRSRVQDRAQYRRSLMGWMAPSRHRCAKVGCQ